MGAAQSDALVIRNSRISGNFCILTLEHGKIAHAALPGQFMMVRVNGASQPLLRRPFGIHRVKGDDITLLYEVCGPGTEILSQRKSGERLDVIGPLGNGFPWRAAQAAGRRPILVAGGMGVAPLVFLAQKIVQSPQSRAHRKPLVLLGVKTKKHILCEKEFKTLGCHVDVSTDDGSCGYKGYVSEFLKQKLSAMDRGLLTIYACGPRPMLKEITRIALALKMPAYLSLEEHMACGFGACLGCAVSTHQGYKRVCKDGPVFGVEEIMWE